MTVDERWNGRQIYVSEQSGQVAHSSFLAVSERDGESEHYVLDAIAVFKPFLTHTLHT